MQRRLTKRGSISIHRPMTFEQKLEQAEWALKSAIAEEHMQMERTRTPGVFSGPNGRNVLRGQIAVELHQHQKGR